MGGRLRFGVSEFSGALGDLGTFLPLSLGVIAINGLDGTSVFISAGLLYVAAGLYFRVPMPVQPLKAMCATAIAIAATPADLAAAGLIMGALFLAVAAVRLDRRLARFFPRPVVRGIQLGLSAMLITAGWKLLVTPFGTPILAPAIRPVPAGLLVGAATAVIVLLSKGERAFPSALVAVVFGILCGLLCAGPDALVTAGVGFVKPRAGLPGGAPLEGVIVALVLPQVALTFGNSIVATADACDRYYGTGAARVTTRSLSVSVGAANIASALAGGIPMCHGSGGVTAHYRFGARTAGANIMIGSLFALLAIVPGRSLSDLARLLPAPVLGVLLVYVGIEHARLLQDVARIPREMGVALAIGIVTFLSGNLSIAIAAGILVQTLLGGIPRTKTADASPGAAR